MSIVITGSTGHIGSRVTEKLLAAGADIALLARSPEKLSEAARSKAQIRQGSALEEPFLRQATEGAQALFWLTPNNIVAPDQFAWYDQVGQTIASAVQANRIPFVVNISSAGAQLPKAGPITGLGLIEKRLNATDANVIHLRPGFFFENILGQLDSIRDHNGVFMPISGDIPFPQIATRDIGDTAARYLLERTWSGKTIHGLHGPADLTFNEATQIVGEAVGRPIQFVTISAEQARQTFLSWGASPDFADKYVDLFTGVSQPGAIAEPRTPATTTPTTLTAWAREVLRPLL